MRIIKEIKTEIKPLLCTVEPPFIFIVRLLVAILHVGMTGKQDGGYTSVGLTSTGLSSLGQNIIHSPVARVVYG